jgi:hypothetical protein
MNLALTALLVFCLIAWGFVLVPPAVRLLSGVIRPSDSIGSFRTKMAVLAGSTPSSHLLGPVAPPAGVPVADGTPPTTPRQVLDLAERRRTHAHRNDAARRRAATARRRTIFTGLLASVPVTFLLAVVVGGPGWTLFTLSLLAFAGYTALLWQMQQAALERRRKVAVLPTSVRPAGEPTELRRISVVGR